MTIRVFVQNEAGSCLKNYHDEKTLAFKEARTVSHPYPFPYGFVLDTEAADGCNVDCFVITERPLRTGDIVECEPVALMEQFEDGVDDHNVLAGIVGEQPEINAAVRESLRAHVHSCFRHIPAKQISVGGFLDSKAAVDYLAHRV